ncbi:hypothetical protein FNV43_RR10975 [Rhamnella rubrinervis]|uniref:VQ domain-containing protein n=1 Tax=Rhamnella rubrinervis TaxID=2594499 RepID=A0A8K0H5F4_9ROSA|nr:hypothetical protein FNV43_RR10975 [Rhamnella rubrinervis]
MDSGNSGSMQSSSGDEEHDSSRAPGFLNINPPTHHFAPNSDSNPEPPNSLLSHYQNHPQPAFFDLSSNYYQALSQSQPNSNPNFLLNLDTNTDRSRGQRSDQTNCANLGNLSSPPSSSLSILASQGPGGHASGPGPGPGPFSGPPSTMQLRQPVHSESTGPRGPAQASTNVGRNSKKRTRASRRAPTTVLTTDTSNFRAMVQEFTGIPAPPFSGSSYSRRFDLFGSSMRTAGHMDTLGPLYPLRPSAQKVQPSPFLSSSSPLLSNNMIEATNVATTSNNNFLSSSNYQPPSSSDHHHHHQGLPKHVLNMQNPILSFQSLPSQPLHPSLSLPGFGSRPHQGTTLSMEELDMSRGFINADHLDHGGVVGNDGGRQDLFRGLEGNSQPRVSSCKMNYAAASSTSEFHHPDKGLEMNIVSTRGTEGTVDSWICPSD